jgi:hypothetical protein
VGHLHAGQVAEQHAVAVQRALGRAGRAGGEDHHRRIVGTGILGVNSDAHRPRAGGNRRPRPRPVDGDQQFEQRQPRRQPGHLRKPGRIRDHGLGARRVQPVFQRFDAEEQRQRHRDRAELVDRHMGDGRLEGLRQEQRHPVAAHNALRSQRVGEGIGAGSQFAIGEAAASPSAR